MSAQENDLDDDLDRPVSEIQKRSLQARRAKLRATAQRLQQLMERRGWIQADLARHSGLKKDVVSKTLTGRSFPTKASLDAMARALGVPITDLSDVYVETDVVKDDAVMSMHVPQGRAGVAWLTINKLVRTETAVRVMQLVADDDTDAAD